MGAESEIPGAELDDPVVQSESLQHRLRVAGQKLELGFRLLRLREPHDFDFIELVLPNEPPDIASVRSRLSPKARRLRHVGDGQRRLEDLVCVEVRQRDLCRRDEIQRARIVRVPAAGLEEIRFELRKLPGTEQRGCADKIGRRDLRIPVLAGVEIHHEGAERAREPGPHPVEHREARSRQLARALEVEDAEPLTDVPVRLRLEAEARLLAPCANDGIVFRGRPDGGEGVGDVGHCQQQLLDPALDLLESPFELRDARADGFEILSSSLERGTIGLRELCHVLVRGVALGLLGLHLDDEHPTARRKLGDGIEPARRFRRATAERYAYLVQMVCYIARVEHGMLLLQRAQFGDAEITRLRRLLR